MDLSKSIPKVNSGYCVRNLGDETIFLSEKGDAIHSIDEVGSFIWSQIDGERTLEDILDAICREYEVDQELAQKDLLNFVTIMEEKGVLHL